MRVGADVIERAGRGWAGSGEDEVLVEVSERGLAMRENLVVRDPDGKVLRQEAFKKGDRWLADTVRWTWKIKVFMHLELELMNNLRERAEDEAIRVFGRNLKDLLLAACDALLDYHLGPWGAAFGTVVSSIFPEPRVEALSQQEVC